MKKGNLGNSLHINASVDKDNGQNFAYIYLTTYKLTWAHLYISSSDNSRESLRWTEDRRIEEFIKKQS